MYGLYAIGWTAFQIVSTVCQLGLDKGVLYYGPRHGHLEHSKLKALILQSVSFATIAGLAVGAVCYFASPWLAVSVFGKAGLTPVLRGFSLTLPFAAALRVASAATRTTQRMEFSVWAEMIGQPAVGIALFVALYLAGGTLLSAVGAVIASYIIALGMAAYFSRSCSAMRFPDQSR